MVGWGPLGNILIYMFPSFFRPFEMLIQIAFDCADDPGSETVGRTHHWIIFPVMSIADWRSLQETLGVK